MRDRQDSRRYTPEQLAYFQQDRWVARRRVVTPLQCNDGPVCWVREGPPAYRGAGGSRGFCLGCGGSPLPAPHGRHGNFQPSANNRRKP